MRWSVIGAVSGLVVWVFFCAVMGFFFGANDEFFRCERFNIVDAIRFAVEISAFLFPVTLGVMVVGAVAGPLIARFLKRGR